MRLKEKTVQWTYLFVFYQTETVEEPIEEDAETEEPEKEASEDEAEVEEEEGEDKDKPKTKKVTLSFKECTLKLLGFHMILRSMW